MSLCFNFRPKVVKAFVVFVVVGSLGGSSTVSASGTPTGSAERPQFVSVISSSGFAIRDGEKCQRRGDRAVAKFREFVCARVVIRSSDGKVVSRQLVWQLMPLATTTTTSTTTTIPRTCAQGGSCRVGDIGPGGGIIFYDAGGELAWGRYLEAAPQSAWNGADTRAVWGCYGVSISGARGERIGDGAANTRAIVQGCSEANIGARIADALVIGGRDDWFVPSIGELRVMYQARALLPGLVAGTYQSSTERDAEFSILAGFDDGIIGGWGFKFHAWYLRPIRYVRTAS